MFSFYSAGFEEGTTVYTATAEVNGQTIDAAPLTVNWISEEVDLDFTSISLTPTGRTKVPLHSYAKFTANIKATDGTTPLSGITVKFTVTYVSNGKGGSEDYAYPYADANAASATAPSSDATAQAASTPGPITKEIPNDADGNAVLVLTNPLGNKPGTYRVTASATNGLGAQIDATPVLVTWVDKHDGYGAYGYGEEEYSR